MSTGFVIDLGDGTLSARQAEPAAGRLDGGPLIVALHGGSYSAAFFDVPGYSLLDRATAGCFAVTFAGPGYWTSSLVQRRDRVLEANAGIVEGVAYSIDFHHAGRAFQQDQIAFASACADTSKLIVAPA